MLGTFKLETFKVHGEEREEPLKDSYKFAVLSAIWNSESSFMCPKVLIVFVWTPNFGAFKRSAIRFLLETLWLCKINRILSDLWKHGDLDSRSMKRG